MRVEKNKAFAYRVPIGDYNYWQCWKIHNVFVFLLTFCLVGGQKKREMVARVIIVLGFQHKRLGNVLKYQLLSNFFYFDKSWNGKMIHLKCENFLPFANMRGQIRLKPIYGLVTWICRIQYGITGYGVSRPGIQN